jgi:hypothetical protein
MSSMNTRLDNLPQETRLGICKFLDAKDLFSLQLVNASMRQTARTQDLSPPIYRTVVTAKIGLAETKHALQQALNSPQKPGMRAASPQAIEQRCVAMLQKLRCGLCFGGFGFLKESARSGRGGCGS